MIYHATAAAAPARTLLGLWLVCLLVATSVSAALAGDCAETDALGTARVMAISPTILPRVGTVQYHQTVPLRDHEVVLSFDDGPLPSSTPAVLDALAAQCVKASFFIMGEQARTSPGLVRREYDEGHTIGTHTETHPDLAKMPLADAENEIQAAIADVNSALGPTRRAAPFFRAPYLSTTPAIERYLAVTGLMLWSIDVDPEDWRPLTPDEVVARSMAALAKSGSGIILMHDVQAHTAAALPKFFRELKSHGYSIVHVVFGDAKEAAAHAP